MATKRMAEFLAQMASANSMMHQALSGLIAEINSQPDDEDERPTSRVNSNSRAAREEKAREEILHLARQRGSFSNYQFAFGSMINRYNIEEPLFSRNEIANMFGTFKGAKFANRNSAASAACNALNHWRSTVQTGRGRLYAVA